MGRNGRSGAPTVVRMRFERIFEDLEGRFAHYEEEEMRAVAEELGRAERAQLTLADRLRGADGRTLTLRLGASLRLTGTVDRVGPDWVVRTDATGPAQQAVVPLAASTTVEGLPARARTAPEGIGSALGLGSVLRGIARDRSVVRLETTAGQLVGRLAAVGADTVDVRSLPTGEHVTAAAGGLLTIATASVLAVLPR